MADAISMLFKIDHHKNLPTVPHVYARLIEAWHEGDIHLSKIAAIIKLDPALSHKVMVLASKTNHHQHARANSIEAAVEIIGPETLKAVISHASTRQVFDVARMDSIKSLTHFWRHAMTCAHVCELIAREIAYPYPNEAFLSGLLHDVGKLVLFSHYPKKYNALFYPQDPTPDMTGEEKTVLGFDHTEAGAGLIQTWGHSSFIADAVLYHHHSLESIQHAFPLVQIVYTANILADSRQENRERGLHVAQELLGFDPHQVDEISVHMNIKAQESFRFLGLDDPDPGDHKTLIDFYPSVQNTIQQEVRDASLLSNVIQNLLEAVDRDEIIQEIKRAIWVMFDINDIMLFLYEPQENRLIGQVDGHGADLAMRIPMKATDSLPVSCLLKKETIDSFTLSSYAAPTILDAQLINRLGKEGMLCIPLMVKESIMGCILLGVDKASFPFLSNQRHLLDLIARKSAASLYVERERRLKIEAKVSLQEKEAHINTRKIVHEANNPLGIIKNYLKVLEIKLSDQDIVCDEIRIINEEISRVGVILKGLTSKNEPSLSSTEPVDLNEALSDTARLLGETLKSRGQIEMHLNLDDELPKAGVDKDSVKQIILNLLKNAAEAIPDGGSIYLQTIYVPDGSSNGTQQKNGLGTARIQIRDNGPGLSDMVRSRLFEPNVTSKPDHDGLGLSVVKNLIHQLNGSIDCESSDKGTCFTIEMPV
jgi:nitrogen-specific signal transduction histidine kinase/HD-like signal output (HDOD) protein